MFSWERSKAEQLRIVANTKSNDIVDLFQIAMRSLDKSVRQKAYLKLEEIYKAGAANAKNAKLAMDFSGVKPVNLSYLQKRIGSLWQGTGGAKGWSKSSTAGYFQEALEQVFLGKEPEFFVAPQVQDALSKFYMEAGRFHKDTLTVYRGIAEGTRETAVVSSWTTDRKVAERFAGRTGTVLEKTVKGNEILFSHQSHPKALSRLAREKEVVLLGKKAIEARTPPDMVPLNINEQWFDALIRHQIYLLRVSGSVSKDINGLLSATEKDIAAKIQNALAGKTKMSPARVRRAERLLKQLKAIRSRAWDKAEQLWVDSMRDLTTQEVQSMQRTLSTMVPVELDTVLPSSAKLKSLVTNRPFEGKILRSWAKNHRRSDIERIEAQVRIGLVQGESAQVISRRVVGTAKLRGRNGVTQITRNNATALTRTAVNHFGNAAREEFFSENSDIFDKEIFVATLDGRTTPVCRANDGKRFPINEGPIPPLHFSCRSLRAAEINGEAIGERPMKPVTEKMLLREYAEQNQLGRVVSRADLPHGWKGKFDSFAGRRVREMVGRVPAKITYQDWLGRQSVVFQDDVLGRTRGRLFRRGNLSLDKFVDHKGKQIPLADLADTEAAAFRAAGLNPADF